MAAIDDPPLNGNIPQRVWSIRNVVGEVLFPSTTGQEHKICCTWIFSPDVSTEAIPWYGGMDKLSIEQTGVVGDIRKCVVEIVWHAYPHHKLWVCHLQLLLANNSMVKGSTCTTIWLHGHVKGQVWRPVLIPTEEAPAWWPWWCGHF